MVVRRVAVIGVGLWFATGLVLGDSIPVKAGLAVASRALADYDAGVRQHKLAGGHNVSLQLDDPYPPLLSSAAAAPLSAAVAILEGVIRGEPEHPTVRPLLGQILGRLGRSKRAVEVLEEHVKLRDDDATGWNRLGVAHSRLGGPGSLARKIECYQKTVELDEDNAQGWANLSNALTAAGRLDEAIEAGLRATELQEHFVYAWMNLGVAYGNKPDVKKERWAYQNSIRVPESEEKCPFARFNLALSYEREKIYDKAVAWYQDALRVGLPQGPRSREAALFHHNLARALYHQGEHAAATLEATEALKIDPEIPEPYSLLGHLFQAADRPEDSRRMFLKATALLKEHGPSRPDKPLGHREQ